MLRKLIAAAGFSLLASAALAATPDISGVWHVQGQIVSGNRYVGGASTCTFVQKDGKLSGSCVGPNASGPLTGFISGNNVARTYRNIATTSVGINGETGFNGTYVDAHLIQGTMTSTASAGKGTFTQTR